MAKQSTSYRLSPEALAIVEDLVRRTGLSHAGVIEVCLRQGLRWADLSPGSLAEDVAAVRLTDPPPAARKTGRPRKRPAAQKKARGS